MTLSMRIPGQFWANEDIEYSEVVTVSHDSSASESEPDCGSGAPTLQRAGQNIQQILRH